MKTRYEKVVFGMMIAGLIILIFGCGNDKPNAPAPVSKLEIVKTEKIMTDFGTPALRVTVENQGNQIVWNVHVAVQIFKGGVIIGGGDAFPGDLKNINPGETAVDDAIFFNFKAHSDYETFRATPSFLTRR